MCVGIPAAWIDICENVCVQTRGDNDIEFVNIAEFVCDNDHFCECLAENVHVCIFVHETCGACVCCGCLVTYSLRVYISEGGELRHLGKFFLLPNGLAIVPTLPRSLPRSGYRKHLYVFGSLRTLGHIPKMTLQADTGWALR